MISDELRRALEKLNRGPLQAGARPQTAGEAPARKPVSIESIGRARIVEGAHGACVVFERTVEEFFEDPEPVVGPFRNVFVKGRHALGTLEAGTDWHRALTAEPGGIVFLDIETLGLVGTPVFLVGLARWEMGRLAINQFFARDYSEEATMLACAREALGKCACLVTFNGKTFDVPTIRDRMAAHLLAPPEIEHHFDLLHESRRRYKRILADCKLQTLEQYICGRRRVGDVPGDLIPQLYHDFVATGEASGIRDILHHNALDMIAMVEILSFMAGGGELRWTE